jgi:hypothetical protein
MRCEEPVKILKILRLTEQGYSQREIAQSIKCGKSTVGEITKRCRNCKLQYEAAAIMTNDEIKLLLYPDSYGRSVKGDRDWPIIHERLQGHYIVRRTPPNYHVEYADFYYSVPHGLYKQLATIRSTAITIEILNDNRERVALHQRRFTGSRYVTNLDHMPPNHRHQYDANQFDGAKYRMWAKNIGKQTYAAIDYLLSSQIVEE